VRCGMQLRLAPNLPQDQIHQQNQDSTLSAHITGNDPRCSRKTNGLPAGGACAKTRARRPNLSYDGREKERTNSHGVAWALAIKIKVQDCGGYHHAPIDDSEEVGDVRIAPSGWTFVEGGVRTLL